MKLLLRRSMLSTALTTAPLLLCLAAPVLAQQEIDPDHFDGASANPQAYSQVQREPQAIQRTSKEHRVKKDTKQKQSATRLRVPRDPKLTAAALVQKGKK